MRLAWLYLYGPGNLIFGFGIGFYVSVFHLVCSSFAPGGVEVISLVLRLFPLPLPFRWVPSGLSLGWASVFASMTGDFLFPSLKVGSVFLPF